MADSGIPRRTCSKQTCNRDAMCTLTYVYSDSTAVIGALSARREPHAYDLCPVHADSLTAPKGWRVVRLESPDGWNRDDLDAVVEAVRADEDPAPARTLRGTSLGVVPPPGAPRSTGAHRTAGSALRDVSYRGGILDARAHGAANDQTPTENATESGGSIGSPEPNGVHGARDLPVSPSGAKTGHSATADTIANVNQVGQDTRSVPLPAALRIPHWRRP